MDLSGIMNGVLSVTDWIETYIINGFLGNLFGLAVRFGDVIMWLISFLGTMGSFASLLG